MNSINPQQLEEDIIKHKPRNPLYGLIALFVAVSLFFLSIQGYIYLVHPAPTNIVSLNEIQSFLPNDSDESFTSHNPSDVKIVINDTRDPLKKVANFVAANGCKKADRVCQSKAIFYFVRDNIRYVSDGKFHDALENPLTTLKTGGADCEDMAVLLLGLQRAIGNEARLVFVPGHAYAQIRIPKYKGGKWLNLEATCKSCEFNELPESSTLAKKNYIEL